MKKNKLLAALCMLFMLMSLAGGFIAPVAAEEEVPEVLPRDETIVVWMHYPFAAPDLMNPYVPGNAFRWHGTSGAAAMLHCWNLENGTIDFYVAKSMEYSSDYKTLTYHLRENAKWSDGVPFTSGDVAFTINMLIENPTLVAAASMIEYVDEVETPDDHTVIIHLKKANPRFHLNFDGHTAELGLVPKHVWEGEDPSSFRWSMPESVGPYVLVKSRETEQVFKRIEGHWWGEEIWGEAQAKYVWFRYVSDELLIPEVIKGNYDLAFLVKRSEYDIVRGSNPYIYTWEELGAEDPIVGKMHTAIKIVVNHRKYPWNLPEVRKAISLLVDREQLREIVQEGVGELNPLVVVPLYATHRRFLEKVEEAGLLDKYEPLKYDADEAVRILEEDLGFTKGADGIYVTPNGTRLELEEIDRESYLDSVLAADLMSETFRQYGIDMKVRHLADPVFFDRYDTAMFDIVVCILGPWDDPFSAYEEYHSKYYAPVGVRTAGNHPGYTNPELDAIVDQMSELPYDISDPEILDLYLKAQEIIYRDNVEIGLLEHFPFNTRNTQYWTGWSSAKDPYNSYDMNDWITWSEILRAKRVGPVIIEYVGTWFTAAVTAFTGIDETSYGPFVEGAYAVIPKEDADRLIGEGLASYTPPTPVIPVAEILDAIEGVQTSVQTLSGNVESLSGNVESLSGQMTTITIAAALEGVVIVVMAIALIMARKK